jgi:hypothetical protein
LGWNKTPLSSPPVPLEVGTAKASAKKPSPPPQPKQLVDMAKTTTRSAPPPPCVTQAAAEKPTVLNFWSKSGSFKKSKGTTPTTTLPATSSRSSNKKDSSISTAKKQKQDDKKKKTTPGLLLGWNSKKSEPTAVPIASLPRGQASAEPTQENHPVMAKPTSTKKTIMNTLPPLGGLFGGWIMLVAVMGVLLSIMASYLLLYKSSFIPNHLCGPLPMNSRLVASHDDSITTMTTTTAVAPWWAPGTFKQLAFNTVCNHNNDKNDRPRTKLEWNGEDGRLTIWELTMDGDKGKVVVTRKKLESVLVHSNKSNNNNNNNNKDDSDQATVMLTLSSRGGGKPETIAAPWGKVR